MYQNIRKQELGAEAGIGYRVQAAWLGTDTLSGASICLGLLPFLCSLCPLCQTPLEKTINLISVSLLCGEVQWCQLV